MTGEHNLTGSFLIAMPGMGDPRFSDSVVYMCDHSDKGAMGLIVNKPTSDLSFAELLEQVEITPTVAVDQLPVYFGGPVETGRGFVLHSGEYESELRSLQVQEDIVLTPTLDVLEDIATGQGPCHAMMLLGYAGWGAGQLEGEFAQNGWLTCPADQELLFHVPASEKWARSLERLGVNPAMLSGSAGSA